MREKRESEGGLALPEANKCLLSSYDHYLTVGHMDSEIYRH